jgi:voltage-gated sodium channel
VKKAAMEHEPLAWLFFIPFILIATFVVLNLFIGVIVESIQNLRAQKESADAAAMAAESHAARVEAHADSLTLLREIRALRSEVASLREALPDRQA